MSIHSITFTDEQLLELDGMTNNTELQAKIDEIKSNQKVSVTLDMPLDLYEYYKKDLKSGNAQAGFLEDYLVYILKDMKDHIESVETDNNDPVAKRKTAATVTADIELASRLRGYLDQHRMSVRDFVRHSGVSREAIYQLLHEKPVRATTRLRVERIIGIKKSRP